MAHQLSASLRQVNRMVDLDLVFSMLRESWCDQWMTLPRVLDACQQVLFDPTDSRNPECEQLLKAAMLVCQNIERSCQGSIEPAYHNRLHFADAMVSLTTLMRLQAKLTGVSSPAWMAALLLTVSAHDFSHPGGANAHPHQIEQHSLVALQPMLEGHLDPRWFAILSELILHTDPADVPGNHAWVQGKAFQWDMPWASVLLNEADILASASMVHGPSLSMALSEEWKQAQHPLHEVVGTAAGRLHFLKSIQFTSQASSSLGIPEVIQTQIKALA